MSTKSPRSLHTLSAFKIAENRIMVRDACTETAHECARSSLHTTRAIKAACKELGCRASYCAECDLQVALPDGTNVDLNWDIGIDGYDYESSTADAELLQAAEDAPVALAAAELAAAELAAAAPAVLKRQAEIEARILSFASHANLGRNKTHYLLADFSGYERFGVAAGNGIVDNKGQWSHDFYSTRSSFVFSSKPNDAEYVRFAAWISAAAAAWIADEANH